MRIKLGALKYLVAVFLLSGCSTTFLRIPASFRNNYNPEKVRLLSEAANHGMLFQFDDEYLKDLPKVNVSDSCQITDEEAWGEHIFSLLKRLERYSGLYKRFHVLRFEKGDNPNVSINRDLDGGTYLVLTYQKVQVPAPLTDEWKRRCPGSVDHKNQVTVTKMDFPSNDAVIDFLQKSPDRGEPERFKYDRSFLHFLAQRVTVFRLINPSLAGEKSLHNEYVLASLLNQLGSQIKEDKYPYIDYWLQEIDQRSRMGKQLKFFTALQESRLAKGVGLDGSVSSFILNLSQQLTSTYLFVSYRFKGKYEYSTLAELDECLRNFNPYASNNYDTKPERFLNKGYSCEIE